MSIVQQIFRASDGVKDKRTIKEVLIKLYEEVGELSTEVLVESSNSYKVKGSDGIIGESIDAIICLVDLIRIHNTDITEEDLQKVLISKLNKWIKTKS